MTGTAKTALKFGSFVVVMAVLTAALFVVFGQYRTGPTTNYTAVFADVSGLKTGDTVRISGIRVGTVDDVALQPDNTVLVSFDADRGVVLTEGTSAAVRYLNLVGDRYLELLDTPGSTRIVGAGSQIPVQRTERALDLDLLLGGLKPVVQGLDPAAVNALTGSLIEVFQGQGGEVESLLARTSSFSTAIADNGAVVQQLIDSLNEVLGTVSSQGDEFGESIQRLEQLITELAAQRDPIGEAITALDAGTASLADLMTRARAPLAGTVDELNRLAPLLANEQDNALLDISLQKAPGNYRKLVRLGAYGSWLNQYLCGLSFRVTDLQGRTAVFPWIKQDVGRCAEP